jgi:flagellar FliL protein
MATSAPPQAAAHTEPAKKSKGGKKKLIVMALLLVLLLGGAGAAAYFFYFLPKNSHPAEKQAEKLPPPVFFAIDPFTVNLQSDDGERYLHIGLTLKLADPKIEDELKEHMPEIRSRILILLSNKHPAELTTVDGKTILVKEIREQIETPFTPGGPVNHVNEVLFTDFVVQ